MFQLKLITPPSDIAELLCMPQILEYCKGLRTVESQANYEKCLQDKDYLNEFRLKIEKDLKGQEDGILLKLNKFPYDSLLQNIPETTHYVAWLSSNLDLGEYPEAKLQNKVFDKLNKLKEYNKIDFDFILWINSLQNQSVSYIRHAQVIVYKK